MKKIEAVIREEKLEDITDVLEKAGNPGIMVTHIEGHGQQKGLVEQFRGRKYKVDFLPKVKIEIVVKDNDVDKFVKAIAKTARTGEIGDGKIFVYNIEDVIRIRTDERGDVAI